MTRLCLASITVVGVLLALAGAAAAQPPTPSGLLSATLEGFDQSQGVFTVKVVKPNPRPNGGKARILLTSDVEVLRATGEKLTDQEMGKQLHRGTAVLIASAYGWSPAMLSGAVRQDAILLIVQRGRALSLFDEWQLEGTVKDVFKDGTVLLSVGRKDGAEEGELLEVFRLKPAPRYVGSIRVISVGEAHSLGRLLDERTQKHLRLGDTASRCILGP
jgi:hypothetical protein